MVTHAKAYQWAEQAGFGAAFVNWPKSMYKSFQTNSNTFVRDVMNTVKPGGVSMIEMDGSHPGNLTPSQNTDTSVKSGLIRFYPAHTPWKGAPAKPKPAGIPTP